MSPRRSQTEEDRSFDRDVEVEALASHLTDLIAEVMDRTNVTRAELARRLGVSRAHITQILSGERNMTLRTVAEALYELGHRLEARAIPLEEAAGEPTWVLFGDPKQAVYAFGGEFVSQLRRGVRELAGEKRDRWAHFDEPAGGDRRPERVLVGA
jgi:transcriptional regulator with XRE-family HTH domain